MDYEDIRREMAKVTINFEREIINAVVRFLGQYYSCRPVEAQSYQVAAATAIVCETYKVPTVTSASPTGSGIKIENVMQHIGTLSK